MKNNTNLRFKKSNKRIGLIAIFALLFSFSINAQVFWTENFNNGCAGGIGCGAINSYVGGVNGPWTSTLGPGNTGTDPNTFYVSCRENGNPAGAGGSACGAATTCGTASATNSTLHIGNIPSSPLAALFCPGGDCGAAYDAGLGAGNVETDIRAQSPTINCTGHTGITLAFNYILAGQPGTDFVTVDYSTNNGATWTTLTTPALTALCGSQGLWTAFSIALPATCDNNPQVKIGFHWINNDDGAGSDPSFAVDNVTLSTSSVTSITTGNINPTTICACSTVNVPFTSSGTFNAGNIYKAELSDALGSFGAPVIIGVLASTANVGTISCTIPCNTPSGTNYLINVISSNPVVTGTNNGVALTINAADNASFSYSSPTYCQNGTTSAVITGLAGGSFTATPAGLSITANGATAGDINLTTSTLGTYTVTYTTNGPCPATSTTTVTITAAPNASFTYSSANYCVGGANPSPVYTTGTAGTFSSTAGLVFVSTGTGQIDLTASTPGTYTVTNTIAAAGGCPASTATFTVTINPVQSSAFTYASSTFCSSGVNPSPTISGVAGGNFTATPIGLTFSSALTGQIFLAGSILGTYTVTYTSPNPCSTTSTFVVTITNAPNANFSYAGSPYCQFGANPLPTFAAGASAGTFSSTPGLIFVSTSTGEIDLTLSLPGTYTVTNTISASGSCPASSATATITINASNSASFSYIGSPYCQSGLNPSPTYSGGGVAGNFTSTAGLNIVAATGAVNLSLSTPGTYTVTNTVPGVGACPPTVATATITIATSLSATFNYTPASYCSNAGTATVTYTGTGTAGNFTATPAGLTLNAATGAVTLGTSTAGTYTVTNTIAASGSCPATSATSTITITQAAVATFSYTGSPYCQSGTNASPTFSGGGVAGTFTAPAGLTINAANGLITLSTSTPGTYTVTNTIAASGGCPQIVATSSVTIVTSPTATFGYNPTTFCTSAANPSPVMGAGATIGTFTATPAGLTINAATGVITLSTSTPGTYTVTNTVAAVGGCPAATATATITISASPNVTVTSITLCTGSTGTITASGATSYTWSAGATAGAGGTATVNPVATTTYTVTGTTGTCTGTAVSTVTVQICNPPVANFYANPLVSCYTGSQVCVTYTDSSTNNPTSWQWSFPGGTPNSSTSQFPGPICYNAIGQYTSLLIVTNATGTDTLLRTNYVSLVAPIQPAITGNTNVNSCESTELTAVPAGTAYFWGPGGDCNTCQTFTIAPPTTTQVWLNYTDINGCNATDTTTVTVSAIYTYFMPTGFSPNGDNINDEVIVYGKGINFINLKIFDRVGEKVFETSTINFNKDKGYDISDGWDGRLHGILMNENTFVYELQVTYCNGETVKENGSLTMVK